MISSKNMKFIYKQQFQNSHLQNFECSAVKQTILSISKEQNSIIYKYLHAKKRVKKNTATHIPVGGDASSKVIVLCIMLVNLSFFNVEKVLTI